MMESDSLLRRRDVLAFLVHLEKTSAESIEPVFERTRHRYPSVENFVENDVEVVLDGLSTIGLLEKQVLDSIMVCPSCESYSHMLKPVCPTCSSGRLMKGNVIEHLICGYVDFEQEFYSRGFKCVKCGKEMKALGVDYRRAGVFYKCISCGRVTAVPVRRFICTECGRASMEEELSLKPIFRYIVLKEKLAAVKGALIDVSPLVSYLESKGYTVNAPAKVTGSSGVVHEFTVSVNFHGEPSASGLVADIVNQVTEKEIYGFFTKTFDVKAGASLLLVVGKIDEKIKRLVSMLNIKVAEYSSTEELVEKSKSLFEDVLKQLKRKNLERQIEFLQKIIEDLEKS